MARASGLWRRPISQGEVLCVAPGEGEEYEEWEMGPDGTMVKVQDDG
eukprot:COSAG05_NODE_3995_length_1731_cov_1.308824_2_plen_47_part_00